MTSSWADSRLGCGQAWYAGADTLEALAVLEDGIGAREAAGEPDCPGLLYTYLHVQEMSPHFSYRLGCVADRSGFADVVG